MEMLTDCGAIRLETSPPPRALLWEALSRTLSSWQWASALTKERDKDGRGVESLHCSAISIGRDEDASGIEGVEFLLPSELSSLL